MVLRQRVELEKDFYKNELLKMGYFKTPEGLQLYELTLSELEDIYKAEKARGKHDLAVKRTLTEKQEKAAERLSKAINAL
ncbi:Fur-regulated basic protein FbpA [Peribacillus simplex]|uniref:Fur-regulated basic protein FbpA n=1 Tax=Peribacillus simplex TaxID=1478 RepID=UPI003D29EFFE